MNPALAPLAALREKFRADREGFRIFADADCALHDPHGDTPETPARLVACLRGLAALPAETALSVRPGVHIGWGGLGATHDRGYLLALESALHAGRPWFMHRDCAIGLGSDDAILAAAGLAVALGDALAEGASGFALTRPPGHHAGRASAEGFCFLNHAALGAWAFRKKKPGARVAVVDLDLHHGNGTADCLKDIPDTFFFSLHGEPSALMYPNGGFASNDRDAPAVLRHTALPHGTEGKAWLAALDAGLAQIAAFRPDVLLISLGFDGHAEDPFGFFRLTDEDYLSATDRIFATAPVPVGFLLEGGYSESVLERLLPRLVARGAECAQKA